MNKRKEERDKIRHTHNKKLKEIHDKKVKKND